MRVKSVSLVFHFALNGGDARPDSAGGDAGEDDEHDEQAVGHLVAEADHARRGGETAREHLTLGADVPEAHLERGRDGQRDAQQDGEVLPQDPHLAGRAEGAAEHGGKDLERIEVRAQRRDERAQQQRQYDGERADAPRTVPRQRVALDDMEQRFPDFVMHRLCSLPTASSSDRRRAWSRRGRGRCR